ncbi:hypothetical protein BST61_g52 [Cercospora zeina]
MNTPTAMSSPDEDKSLDSSPRKAAGLLDLLAELKLQVLSHLPGKDIQTCRRVCGIFKELIDSKDNRTAITKPILRRTTRDHRHSLRSFGYRNGISLPSYLFVWLSRRGLWQDMDRTRWLIRVGAQQWAFQSSTLIRTYLKTPQPSTNVTMRLTTALLTIIAESLAQVYIDVHCPDLFTPGPGPAPSTGTPTRLCDVSSRARFLALIDTRVQYVDLQFLISTLGLPLSRTRLGRWYRGIRRRTLPHASITNPSATYRTTALLLDIPRGPSPRLAVPQFVLTSFEYFYQDQDPGVGTTAATTVSPLPSKVWVPGRCTVEDLGRLLRRRLVDLSPYSAWCVKSKWADELICQMLGGRRLTKLETAAVAEELYVF